MIIVSMPGEFAHDAMLSAVLRDVGRRQGMFSSVERVLRSAAAERARGTCPVAVDRMLYQLFAGVPERLLRDTAREWYAQYRLHHDPLLGVGPASPSTPVVIVSDAPAVSLRVLAAQFRDVHVLGGTPVAEHGVLTGANATPMAGPARARRVERLLAQLRVEPERCVAYGRSSADTALLELVGSPIVLGSNEYLLAVAARSDWTVRPVRPTTRDLPAVA